LARLGGDLHAYLDTAFDGTKEMREIISTILDKGRNEQRLDSTSVNINDVLTTTLRFWEADAAFKHGVEKILNLDPDLPAVEAVYAHWSQSFDNLLSNAMAAMVDTDVKQLSIRTEFGDQNIRIEIQDTGHGMDETTLERIFDPFFTTRSDGLGTGLGLASVKALLEPYGVTIGVASSPGRGTRFELTLPLVDNKPDAPVSPPQASRRRLRRAGDGAASG
ncbi:MAG: HAMP domain-containing sensor histidine kinase, partial [Pseudomonadota bacterium]|nr:HAMP domain-containing sensor histidine kinase [Pseudomonadota bacterium]